MGSLRHRRPTPALLVAVIALVAALAGTAVAEQASISAKPVTKKKAKKIAKKQAKKYFDANIGSASVASANSASALDQVTFIRSARVSVATGTDGGAIASCPEGDVATGGGGLYPAASGVQIVRSYPSNGTANQAGYSAWEFHIRNASGVPRFLRAYVVCVSAESTDGSNYAPGVNPVN